MNYIDALSAIADLKFQCDDDALTCVADLRAAYKDTDMQLLLRALISSLARASELSQEILEFYIKNE